MIVEKSAFELNPSVGVVETEKSGAATNIPKFTTTDRGRGRGRGRGGRGGRGAKGVKRGRMYGALHGATRGMRDGLLDEPEWGEEPTLTADAPAEGLYNFIQATVCRREVLRQVFNNGTSGMCLYTIQLPIFANDII